MNDWHLSAFLSISLGLNQSKTVIAEAGYDLTFALTAPLPPERKSHQAEHQNKLAACEMSASWFG